VQGRLRGEKLTVRIDSECKHCSEPLSLEVNEELRWRLLSRDAEPLLFEPDIRWDTFRGADIIHDY
jgi:hypothetical protein